MNNLQHNDWLTDYSCCNDHKVLLLRRVYTLMSEAYVNKPPLFSVSVILSRLVRVEVMHTGSVSHHCVLHPVRCITLTF